MLPGGQAGLGVEEAAEDGAGLRPGHGALGIEIAVGVDAAHDTQGIGPEDAGLHVTAPDAGGGVVAEGSAVSGSPEVGKASLVR